MRYFGGKSKISKEIANYINNLGGNDTCNISEVKIESVNKSVNTSIPHTHTHTHYAEPFCGSCNVATKINIPNKLLNDKNNYLIAMFRELQNGWIPPEFVSEEDYKNARINMDKKPHVAGFVGFACSFAGKFFGGYARDSKGCGDSGGNYALRGKNSILKKMKDLQNAEFTCEDFQNLNYNNALIYCDPPYKDTTPYYKKILGEFPYDSFIEWTKKQSENNTVLVSEYKHNVPEGAKVVLEIPSKTSIRDASGNVIDTVEVLWTWNEN